MVREPNVLDEKQKAIILQQLQGQAANVLDDHKDEDVIF
jgi:hypothetical protein